MAPYLRELARWAKGKDADGVNQQSAQSALLIARAWQRTTPQLDVYPTGDVSLTWREATCILNVVFYENGIATYVAYAADTKETWRGRFHVTAGIPDEMTGVMHRLNILERNL